MAKIMYKGKEYSGVPSSAENIAYDNTESGLSATNVQSAIDEANGKFTNNTTSADYDNRVNLSSIANTTGNTYTVPANGFLQGIWRGNQTSGVFAIMSKKLGTYSYLQNIRYNQDYADINVFVGKGDVLTFTATSIYALALFFVPFEQESEVNYAENNSVIV